MLFWWIAGAVVVVLIALAWWSSGRKPGVIPTKPGASDSGVSQAHDAGSQAQRQWPNAGG